MLPHANTNRKKAEVAILISDYFKVIDSTNDKQGHFKNRYKIKMFSERKKSSDWCGSVGWAPAYEPKGRQFNSLSGHLSRLQARSPVGGVQEVDRCISHTHPCLSPCLSPPLSLSLKINK